MLIDSHCHLTDKKFTDIKVTLKRASDAGVKKVIIPTTSVEDARRGVVIAVQEDQFCLVGIHPEEVENITNVDGEISEIRKLTSNSRVLGIGEIGLDYYWDKDKKTESLQIEIFRKQMILAVEKKLPVAIHMRNAEQEMKKELLKFDELPQGQFHCFSGSPEFLQMIISMGFYVSFCGNITYKSAGNLRELVKMVPRNKLLLETDSPYLSPEPLRGTVNSPANVKIIAEFIARELNVDYSEIEEITSQNTKCLYSLDI